MDEWYPFPGPQFEFCSSGEFEVLFGGAAGPGKTDCLIMEATRYVAHGDYSGVLFRRTFPQLQEIVDRCWRWYPKIGGQYRATEHRWYFPSGAKITLSHMQHESDCYNHQGKEYHFAGFDELTQFTQQQYLYIFSRVRGVNPDIPLRVRSTTNPGGVGHKWVKERFVDQCGTKTYVDPVTGLSRAFVPARITDNPILCENDPGYIKRLEALPTIERKRLLDGDWQSFEGQVFSELSQRVHGCQPFDIPPEWPKLMAFDWGFARPWCALYCAVDFDGVLYIYKELYGLKKDHINVGVRQTNDEICRAIRDAEKEKIQLRVADPACWSPTMRANKIIGPSFNEDATKFGLFFLKADNDRIRGKQQFHQRLQLDHETNKDGEVVREWPRLVVFNSCKNWWRTMMELRESQKDPEDVDCFVAGTLIDTENGKVPVENLKTGDFVCTPIGNRKVKKAGLAGRDFTTEIILSNGERIEATNDHKIYIKNIGLVPMCLISPGDKPLQKEDIWKVEKLSTKEQFLEDVTEEHILNAVTAIAKSLEQHCYTEQYGKTALEQYQKDFKYTISTTMEKTTLLKTCNLFIRSIMQDNITKKELKTVGISKNLLEIGEKASGAKEFFKRILKSAVNDLRSENLRALIVANLLKQDTHTRNFVQKNAESQKVAEKKPVQFAERNSSQNLTEQKRSQLAVISVVGKSEKKAVYYLTVEQAHLFFANGVLATNTDQEDHLYDCTRYLCMARPVTPKIQPKEPPGSFAAERKRLIRAREYSRRNGVSLEAAYARIR